jgi:hypothetical protein
MKIGAEELRALVRDALMRAGAHEGMADCTARALVLAESQGLGSHGLSRVGQYTTHLRNGRADGSARASVVRSHGAAMLVDAHCGLAFPACELAVREAIERARTQGMAIAGRGQQPPRRGDRRPPAAGGGGGHGRPGLRQLAGRPCRPPAAGTRSSAPTRWRRRFRAARATRC